MDDLKPKEPVQVAPTNGQIEEAKRIRALLEDWVVRTQYEVAEKTEKRLWAALKSRVWVLGVFLAILAFLGPPMILNFVAEKIKSGLDEDASVLRQRIQGELAEMAMQTARLKSQAETARGELSKLDQYAQEFDKLSPRYDALKAQVDADSARVGELEKELKSRVAQASHSSQEIQDVNSQIDRMKGQVGDLRTRIEGTQQLASGAQLGLTSLGSAVLLSGIGDPAIVVGPLSFSPRLLLSGSNFGTTKGHLYLRLSVGFVSNSGSTSALQTFPPSQLIAAPQVSLFSQPFYSSQPIMIDDASLGDWSDAQVSLSLTDEGMKKVHLAEAETRKNSPVSPTQFIYQFQVQTASGKTSNWYSTFGSSIEEK
jgi:hypothetical protein